ncbi:MAG: T7-like phage primase/helicase protein [Rhodospirillales bacterium]|nr:T7-like phage primase/helicase protein [Rhodospirillales bacterium]
MPPEPRESRTVIAREHCPSCGSSDNLARYDDGSAYCFGMGCSRFEPPTDGTYQPNPQTQRRRAVAGIIDGEYRALSKRRIDVETCRKMGYQIGETSKGPVQLANHSVGGTVLAQKVRGADKEFYTTGDPKELRLWPMAIWPDTGRRIVVTEGEIDAMAVAQCFGLSWPVVSVPKGAAGAAAAIKRDLQWLEGYDSVVLWFDNDEAGRAAVEECVPLFKPGKCSVAYAPSPHKDAGDMLVAGDLKGLARCVYDAKAWRPEGVVTLADVKERALRPIEVGCPWPWEGLTKATFGRREGEVYGFGAGTGVGKTDLFTQIIAHDLDTLGVTCGVLYLEQSVAETAKRVAGKLVGKRFHVPDGSWTRDELVVALDRLDAKAPLHLFEAFGSTSWDVIGPIIRYMIIGLGCRHVFLDHLTALAADEEDENGALKVIMAAIAGLAQETGAKIHFISHLSTPDNKPHEEGGRVMTRHFRGSRTIGFWSHMMFGLERNTQAEDPEERSVATLRCLKDRYTGNATGQTWGLSYDRLTGILTEAPIEAAAGGFGEKRAASKDF